MKKKIGLNLQLFNDGEGDVGGQTSGMEGYADLQGSEEPEILYGIQDDDPDPVEDVQVESQEDNAEPDLRAEYEQFKEKYKDFYGADVQNAINRRFKNQDDYEGKYKKMSDSLAPLYQRYGLQEDDIDALSEAITNDTSLIEELADEKGLTPEQFMYQSKIERENQRYRAENARKEASQKARADYDSWLQQAEEVRQLYPNFDFDKELQNEDFINDIKSGKSVRKAFESAHLDEIIQGAIQTTANNVRKATVDNIQARGMRPSENGSKSRAGAVVKTNVEDFTDKDIENIIRQVRSGKKIRL